MEVPRCESHDGHIAALTFAEQAAVVRQECMAVINEQAEAHGHPKLVDDKPLVTLTAAMASVVNEGAEKSSVGGGWQLLSIAVDTGAAETVIIQHCEEPSDT